jgi:stress-induced morphogen
MYQIKLSSKEFSGISLVKQHRLVNDALKKEIKEMHGLQLTTIAES